MSNDKRIAFNDENAIVRVFKLWAKIAMMIVDGTRDATRVADTLQNILSKAQTKPAFEPDVFVEVGWLYAEVRNSRSATIGFIDDYSKVKFSSEWLQDSTSVHGEIRRARILADSTHTSLNADHFLNLWYNKEKIPEEWKMRGYITFDGDVFLRPTGYRYVLYLYWYDGKWGWGCEWLNNKFDNRSSSAVLVS